MLGRSQGSDPPKADCRGERCELAASGQVMVSRVELGPNPSHKEKSVGKFAADEPEKKAAARCQICEAGERAA